MRRGARETYFVCSGIVQDKLVNRVISSNSPSEASQIYFDENHIVPQEILGPFYKKRTQIIETTRELKLTSQIKKAVYNDWQVNAFILQEPENYAYLVFLKRVDDKKISPPKGVIIVPISDLRIL